MASYPVLSTVETGFGPMRASRTPGRLRHLAPVFELMRYRVAKPYRLSWLCWIARRMAGVVRALPWSA